MKENLDLVYISNIIKENNDNIILALYNNDLELSDLFEYEELDEVSQCWDNLNNKLNEVKENVKELTEMTVDDEIADEYEDNEELDGDYDDEIDEETPITSTMKNYNIYDPTNNVRNKILADIEDIYSENDFD